MNTFLGDLALKCHLMLHFSEVQLEIFRVVNVHLTFFMVERKRLINEQLLIDKFISTSKISGILTEQLLERLHDLGLII